MAEAPQGGGIDAVIDTALAKSRQYGGQLAESSQKAFQFLDGAIDRERHFTSNSMLRVPLDMTLNTVNGLLLTPLRNIWQIAKGTGEAINRVFQGITMPFRAGMGILTNPFKTIAGIASIPTAVANLSATVMRTPTSLVDGVYTDLVEDNLHTFGNIPIVGPPVKGTIGMVANLVGKVTELANAGVHIATKPITGIHNAVANYAH